MASVPFMQVYVADYTADTQHLTCEEDGAYWRLLRAMWRAGGKLPSSDQNLARICGVAPRAWAKMRDTLMEFFTEENGQITQKRLSEEYRKAVDKSAKRAAAGALGGRAKTSKINADPKAKAHALPKHSSEPESEREELSPSGDMSVFAPPPDHASEAFECYNRMAAVNGLPKATKLTPARLKALKLRLQEVGIAEWSRAVESIPSSPFLMGSTGWRANFDFLLQPSSLQKVLEGTYERSPNGKRPDSGPSAKLANLIGGSQKLADRWRAE